MSPHLHYSAVLLLAMCLGTVSAVYGQTEGGNPPVVDPASAVTDTIVPALLIMPIVNYSEKGEAHEFLAPRLHAGLDSLGVIYQTSDRIRPLLRQHRIRSRGWIGADAAQILHRETQARYILLVSWDVFRTASNPEIGLSLRILDLTTLTLVAAVSEGVTGADFTKALGLGTITDLGELADIVMNRSLESLFPVPESRVPDEAAPGCMRIALIPFDNFSSTPNAGDILTNIVLSRLMAHGYFVVEPGFVRELGLTLEVMNRGGVDRNSARSILDNFAACGVMTGTVERFSTARGAPTQAVPELALGIRAMSPQDGNLYLMEELISAGDDGQGIFQSGRVHSLVTLTNQVLTNFLDEVAKKNREDILDGAHEQ
jgi:hypothetical protein